MMDRFSINYITQLDVTNKDCKKYRIEFVNFLQS